MKRLTAGLLALMLLATLLPGCGKKEQWNVDNFFLSDDGTTYSVSYRHDDGTEEVVAEMGSYPQPLTIIAGKLYYVHGGSMVAVDLKDPTQRQTLTEPGLSGLSIGFIDDGAVYCPLATDTEKCYRVALDLSECTRVAIPREQRPTDYDALLDQIYAAVGAIDNRMALRTLRARYSETGSLTSLEMTVWSLQEETYSLNSWADVHVSVQRSGSGFTVAAQDQHRPLPMDSETVAAMLSVQRFVETVKAVDSADLWTSQKTGQPLTIIAGKLYYVHGGSMVAVDLKDPTQRQTLTEPGLSGLSIGFIDDGAVYCPLATDTEKCYRVALDLSECTRVAIPREQRPTDYDALLDQIYAAVGAIDNRMALRTLRARYSETGSLTSLEMTVWSLQEETYSLNSWADVHVSVQRSGSGFTVAAQDQHRPLPMDSETVAAMLSVQRFVETVKAVDSADLWTSQKTGQPLYYQLTYHASEYEAAVAADGGVPCLNPDGSAAQLPQGSLLVLAQCYDRGDANIALTDSQGLTTGALRVIVPAA